MLQIFRENLAKEFAYDLLMHLVSGHAKENFIIESSIPFDRRPDWDPV
ncbi:unnamed protein product [marine sediment metagenome]|uniref:Uncharacterized protein n=1 Tax=marine sediment metagenome TaxID=412755 RepID=X1IUJ8_9ZZZZ